MNFEDFYVFQQVANYGSISKAAQALNFVQSSVTAKIQKLENHFQTPLFYRNRYGVSLTSAGQTLLSYSKQILQTLEEAEKAIIFADIPRGKLTLGSMETTAAIRLPTLLANFHQQYSSVEFHLTTGPTRKLLQLVLERELDGAFIAGPIRKRGIVEQEIFTEELVLVTHSKHFPVCDPALLEQNTLLVFKQGCTYRSKLEEWLAIQGAQPVKIMEFGSLEAIVGCIHAGLGYSLMPRSIVEQMSKQYRLIAHSLPEEFSRVSTYFIYRQDMVASVAFEKFLDLLKR